MQGRLEQRLRGRWGMIRTIETRRYRLTFTEPVLGTIPKAKEVFHATRSTGKAGREAGGELLSYRPALPTMLTMP